MAKIKVPCRPGKPLRPRAEPFIHSRSPIKYNPLPVWPIASGLVTIDAKWLLDQLGRVFGLAMAAGTIRSH